MYHIKTYKGGAGDHDPRQLTWAVFHCDACGHNEDINITGRVQTFQFHVPQKCPKCKSFGKMDRIVGIRKEIEQLTSTQNNILVTIEQLTKELQVLSESFTESPYSTNQD
jgi:phage FluMu protein Com